MQSDATQAVIDALDDVLDKERKALLEGDLDTISELLAKKEELFEALREIEFDSVEGLGGLQGKAARNQVLLDGALKGIRAVAERMNTMRQVRKNLETYDRSGRKTTIQSAVEHKVEKRA